MNKHIGMAIGLALLLALAPGCSVLNPTAKDLLGSTTAGYHNGETALDYTSNKNQENFKADIGIDPATGKLTALHIETTAVTPESAIAKTAEAQAAMAKLLGQLVDKLSTLIPPPATAAAIAGS